MADLNLKIYGDKTFVQARAVTRTFFRINSVLDVSERFGVSVLALMAGPMEEFHSLSDPDAFATDEMQRLWVTRVPTQICAHCRMANR